MKENNIIKKGDLVAPTWTARRGEVRGVVLDVRELSLDRYSAKVRWINFHGRTEWLNTVALDRIAGAKL